MLRRAQTHLAQQLWDAGRWRDRAACHGIGPDLFFPLGERAEDAARQVAEARSICAECSVRLHCLTYALVANPEDGIWGGLAPTERAAMRRARRARRRMAVASRLLNAPSRAPDETGAEAEERTRARAGAM
ncbi:MAG: WhiB family transcriptional regulator [Acidimicrobiales bacterium]